MASLSSQLSEAERERIHLQSRVEQLQRDLADAEEGEPLLPIREPFRVSSLPTFSVRPLEGSRLGLGLCPTPRMARCHLSHWCPPIRRVDFNDLWGLLNLPILHLPQFHLRPAAAVPSTWHLRESHMTPLSPQRGPWPGSPPTILNLLPLTLKRQCKGRGNLESRKKKKREKDGRRREQIEGSVAQGQKIKPGPFPLLLPRQGPSPIPAPR